MANQTIMQGLLESLMQRPQQEQQRKGALLTNLISQPNPLAATVANMLPGQLANVGTAARGLFNIPQPVSFEDMVAKNPQMLTTATGLTELAKAASASGDKLRAAQFTLAAADMTQQKSEVDAQREAAAGQLQPLIDAEQDPAIKAALERIKTSAESGALEASGINSAVKTVFDVMKKPATQTLAPKDVAELYKTFTPESVKAFQADPNATLVPIKKDGPDMTNYKQMLVEAGIPAPEIQKRIDAYTLSLISANKGELTPVQMVSTLNDSMKQIPTSSQTAQDSATLKRLKDTVPLLGTSNPQAYTVISSSLPMLYQSNARAQSEIDAFRNLKGIKESLGDWVTRLAGGTATPESIANMKELISVLDKSILAQRASEAGSVVNAYKGVIPEDVLNRWYTNQFLDVNDDIENIVNNVLGQ